MTALTEARHTAEFIISEGDGHISRESLVAGGTLKAGEVVKITASTLVSYDGSGTVVGIAINAAEDGDLVAYIARLAEVNGNMLTSTEATDGALDAGALAGLATLHIIVR
jgi:DNA/RNA endonuclease YhcR with UshA esterase domain